ncbi:MAG: low molecular weight phosphotyrosine protein phosphatase [Myxococcales bacterium]|nr:low molecular weight phosphotyrosine protein phosphatase [Myxococcales bacterium]
MSKVSVCFVCLGNICRSPTAEGVFRHLVEEAGLTGEIHIDSAGTAAYHAGESPDRRSAEHAARRGIRLAGRARQFVASDFERFDYVLAMDAANHRELERQARRVAAENRLYHCRDFDPECPKGSSVPDPYYGGEAGFEEVLDLCDAACRGLLEHIRREHLA